VKVLVYSLSAKVISTVLSATWGASSNHRKKAALARRSPVIALFESCSRMTTSAGSRLEPPFTVTFTGVSNSLSIVPAKSTERRDDFSPGFGGHSDPTCKCLPRTNLVDVQMGLLRRKIDWANEPPMIRSVRGVGFVLNATALSRGSSTRSAAGSIPAESLQGALDDV
jgi:hypothetical protein